MKMNGAKKKLKSSEGLVANSRHFVMEDNPMKIDLILQVLFDLCPASTLRNCRLVCKQWRNVSLTAWRDKAILCLNKKWNPELNKSPPTVSVRNFLLHHLDIPVPIPRYLKPIVDKDHVELQLWKYPFKNVLITLSLHDYIGCSAKLILEIGRHVTLLNIQSGFRLFPEFLSYLPRMESLELRNCKWKWKSWPGPFISRELKRLTVSWVVDGRGKIPSSQHHVPKRRFFQHFPNMEVLCLDYRTSESCFDEAKKILKIIKSFRASEDVLALRELEIINIPFDREFKPVERNFDTNFIRTIVDCKFPLERLALDLAFSPAIKLKKIVNSIERLILASSSDSLQYLRTSFYFDMDIFIDGVVADCEDEKERKRKLKVALKPIPDLSILKDALKELKLSNGLWGLYLLAHLRLPVLEKLTVEYGKFERDVSILDYQVGLLKGKVFPKLETFELLDNHEIPGPETIAIFANMMPNLCALSCPLDKQAFQVVCQTFKGLKILNVLGASCQYVMLDDESLTGVCNEGGTGTGQPNITDLASLTDLSISRNAGVFSDHSVMYGFLQLPRLYYLSVAFNRISGEGKAKLLSHVKGTVLIHERLNLIDGERDDVIISGESSTSDESELETEVSESSWESSSESYDSEFSV